MQEILSENEVVTGDLQIFDIALCAMITEQIPNNKVAAHQTSYVQEIDHNAAVVDSIRGETALELVLRLGAGEFEMQSMTENMKELRDELLAQEGTLVEPEV